VAVGALGVVFGDIGTSPLYAMRAVMSTLGGGSRNPDLVYGVTSTIIWSLVLVVTVLYVALLLRTDNEGEGGLLALVALCRRSTRKSRVAVTVTLVGMVGAAMFLGDSVVTPAISVLSAAEGLDIAAPSISTYILPIALLILAGIFAVQRFGSGRIGNAYGPVMLVWFVILAVFGVRGLLEDPAALQALSPSLAVGYLAGHPATAFVSLGAVVLAVTGSEALYADLGHFGRPAITKAWLWIVLPALTIAYLGEAAAIVSDPAGASNPFYAVVPGWATIPVLVLATCATIIASQAVIAGTFTVLHQAAGLGLLPVLRTRHTSDNPQQIYMPAANWTLAVLVLAVVAGFGSSSSLAAAYGLAVSVTILVTTSLYIVLQLLRGARIRALATLPLALVVAVFLAANAPKVASGGWLTLGIGAVATVLMVVWWAGQRRLDAARRRDEIPIPDLLDRVLEADEPLHDVGGSAVYLTPDSAVAPMAFDTLVCRQRIVHDVDVVMAWRVLDTPSAPEHNQVDVEVLSEQRVNVVRIEAVLGYHDRPDVLQLLRQAREKAPDCLEALDVEKTIVFASLPVPVLTRRKTLRRWPQRLFVAMDRLATDPVEQLSLPRDRTVLFGVELEL
jgi:KUP system potassium uptake protein